MKQTAVEWLQNELQNSKYYHNIIKDLKYMGTILKPDVFEQAKQIEKQQIIDACNLINNRKKVSV